MEIEDDCHIPVVEANCRYKSPAHYDDELLLETRVLAMRVRCIKFGYRLYPSQNDAATTLLAEGETTHVAVDRSIAQGPFAGEVCGGAAAIPGSAIRILMPVPARLLT